MDNQLSRRRLLQWSIHLAAFYPVVSTGLYGCKNDAKNKKTPKQPVTPGEKKIPQDKPVDFLYYNQKSKVLHYPGLHKKNALDHAKELQKISIADWEKYLENEGTHFAKEHSGLTFEKLALLQFRSTHDMQKPLAITQRAFAKDYVRQNRFNWRVYDLLLQWMALNESIAMEEKWNRFSAAIQNADLATVRKVPKRMAWLKTKEDFDKRVAYITQQKNNYTERLQKRVI